MRWSGQSVRALALVGALLCSVGSVSAEQELTEAERIVFAAKAEAAEIPAQAEAMARLAWFEPTASHQVRQLARHHLVEFGARGMPALRKAATQIDPLYCADLAVATMQAKDNAIGIPADFLATLEVIMWYGSVDAKRVASMLVALHRYVPAMPITIDAIYSHPELTESILRVLPMFGNSGARHTLRRFLNDGSERERRVAATALSRMGTLAAEVLREATLSEDPVTRAIAIEVFLPQTTIADLTALYEYLALYPDDDPGTIQSIRARARVLESVLVKRQEAEAASGDGE